MKKMMWAVVVWTMALCFPSCGGDQNKGKNQENVQQNAGDEANNNKVFSYTSTAELGGHTYKIIVSRQADPTLPKVKDDFNKEFCDNRVTVRIYTGGEEIFNKDFVKETFSGYLTAAEKQGTVLLGMAYDAEKSNAHTICLGAQIGLVGIEEGPAFSVTIPVKGGGYNIARDHNQDTTGNDGLAEE